MADAKTVPTGASVTRFIASVPDKRRRAEARTMLKVLRAATGLRPRMWGPSIVGYGSYHYKYASGREGDCFVAGFSPRKAALTVYIMAGFKEFGPLLKKLGRHKKSVSCLYIPRLSEVDLDVLEEMIRRSVAITRKRYQATGST